MSDPTPTRSVAGRLKAEIPTMQAGRELDALVHERVFGGCAHKPVRWTREEVIARERAEFLEEYGMEAPPAWVGDADAELSGDYPPYKCAKCGEKRVSSRLVAKPYSTDIAAAWLVLDKLMDRAFGVWLACTHEAGWRCDFKIDGTGEITSGFDVESAPLAICLAALQAVDVLPSPEARPDADPR